MRCPKCNKEVIKETEADLNKTYPYVCLNCDEDFFSFELNKSENMKGGLKE